MKSPATYYRFKSRAPGQFGWTMYPALTARHDAQTAWELCARWNQRDAGKLRWSTELALPGSFDIPGNAIRATYIEPGPQGEVITNL